MEDDNDLLWLWITLSIIGGLMFLFGLIFLVRDIRATPETEQDLGFMTR